MSFSDAVKLASRARPELMIITHFGAKMIRADPLCEARDIQKATGVRVMAARDGMKVNIRP